jgi:enolase
MNTNISKIVGRRVWDSRGRPTIEVDVVLQGGAMGRAIAPAGASTGSSEAVDKRDGGSSFAGYDVNGGIAAINGEISECLIGRDAINQEDIDTVLIELDRTPNKARLGGNSLIATSMAVAHATANAAGLPLWRYLARDRNDLFLPLPEIQIFGGGAHAGRRVDIQDFMIIAIGAANYAQALDWTAEVYIAAGKLMSEAGLKQGVADEGGYWPAFNANEQGLDFLVRSIEGAGLTPGHDMAISLDIAATDFCQKGKYHLATDNRVLDSDELSEMLLRWINDYPIVSIEDPLSETDDQAMARFTAAVGNKVEVVADDFICTSANRIREVATIEACNTALIKPNQAGTLTETKAAFEAARAAGWESIVSARSGETEDTTIVDLAIGWGVKQLKVGSFARSERMAKWNAGLRIAESLGQDGGTLAPRETFPWGS